MVIQKFVFVNGCQSLVPLQGGDRNIPLRLAAFVLTSHLQEAQMDRKNSAEHGRFMQLRLQTSVLPLPPLPSAIFISILEHICKIQPEFKDPSPQKLEDSLLAVEPILTTSGMMRSGW